MKEPEAVATTLSWTRSLTTTTSFPFLYVRYMHGQSCPNKAINKNTQIVTLFAGFEAQHHSPGSVHQTPLHLQVPGEHDLQTQNTSEL